MTDEREQAAEAVRRARFAAARERLRARLAVEAAAEGEAARESLALLRELADRLGQSEA